VEPDREIIEDLMRRYRYEEEEAVIAYHLREARTRLFELLRAEARAEAEAEAEAEAGVRGFRRLYEETFIQSNVIPHFSALSNLLATRVLARQFPEGWGFQPPREEG
jgi:hypothetical protein